MKNASYDYIIVGAGSAGCVVASRLSEDPSCSVLLIEAGRKDNNFWLKIPVGYGRTIADERVNWKFMTEPNTALGGREIYWPRGKVLGGSSSINGLIYIRGQAEDYDHWRQLGNTGWGYEDVLPYFRRAEDQENGADDYHGVGGPLRISNVIEKNPLTDAYIESAAAIGIPTNPDFNGADQEGAGHFQGTIKNGQRCSASFAYLKPAMSRKNLTVLTETQTTKINTVDGCAVGVSILQDGVPSQIKAKREVIVSAGSVNSPQLLMLSGIGPAQHLQDMGIPVASNVPGVGQNLQDHYGGQVTWKCREAITMNDVMLSTPRKLWAGMRWLLFRNGPFSVPAGQAGLFTRVLEGSATPDLQFLFQTFSGGYYEDGLFKFSGFANFVCPVRPMSRGHLELASPDHRQQPKLMPNYFSHPQDRKIAVEGVKLTRKLATAQPLAGFIEAEHLPGVNTASDKDIEDYLIENGGCVSHQVGTCKMGSDENAVVDNELRVRGVRNLRVIDASIMPSLVSGNTNAAAIMIGEKGAELVKNCQNQR